MNHRASASTDRSPKGLSALSDGRSLARSPPKTQGEPPARWPSYAVALADYEAETATNEPKWPPLETATEEKNSFQQIATPMKTINDQGTVFQFMTMLMTKTQVPMQPRLVQLIQDNNLL